MNNKPSFVYRAFVAVMITALLGALYYTDYTYKQNANDLGMAPEYAKSEPSTASRPDPSITYSSDVALDNAEITEDPIHSEQNSQYSPFESTIKKDFFAQQLLDAFQGAEVLESNEAFEGQNTRVNRDVLLTDQKYPKITREIRYEYDSRVDQWIPVSGTAWVSDQVLIGLSEGQGAEILQPMLDDLNAEIVQNIRDDRHFLIRFKETNAQDDLEGTLSTLRVYTMVAYAEPNFYRAKTWIPNDMSFHNQWGMNNLGSGSGIYDADIDAAEAWDITRGRDSVLVAVIDTGVQVDHPDLQTRVYRNTLEIANNGIDDDSNGFVDDINGWNFYDHVKGNNDVSDTKDSHGTHIAGIIAATGNNQQGVIGVAPGTMILPVKIINDDGGFTSDLIRGMDYAKQMGASIVNVSLGGSGSSRAEASMIDDLQKHGILLVTASGNSGINEDLEGRSYPGGYEHANIINVAATNWFDELTDYSNYGPETVDVSAPGSRILSTVSSDRYQYESGTSMAAPHVAGVAALVKSMREDWDATMIKEAIMSSVDPISTAQGKTVSGGRVNAYAAVVYTQKNVFFPHGLHIRFKARANGNFVSADSAQGSKLIASSARGGALETFEVVEVDSSTYAFRSLANGRYVTVEAGGEEPLSATRDEISDWELFYPINMGDGTYALRSKANGLLVTAENGGADPLIANRQSIGDWETFEIETMHLLPVGKKVALQAVTSGKYVSPGNGRILSPVEDVAGINSIFEVGLSLDGYLTLRSSANGLFVTAETDGISPMRANKTLVSDWEKFIVESAGDGMIAIRSVVNGRYVTSEIEGTKPLVANRTAIGTWESFYFQIVGN